MTKKRRGRWDNAKPTQLPGTRWTRWEFPRHRGHRLACCDCGLVHEMDFKIVHTEVRTKEGRVLRRKLGHVAFRAARDNRSTAGLRRYYGPTLNKTFLNHAADSLIALYSECPNELERFLRSFRAKVREKIRDRASA